MASPDTWIGSAPAARWRSISPRPMSVSPHCRWCAYLRKALPLRPQGRDAAGQWQLRPFIRSSRASGVDMTELLSPSVSFVIPAYNEESNIEEVVRRSIKVLDSMPAAGEIVVVNDGSQDNSADILARLSAEFPDRIR